MSSLREAVALPLLRAYRARGDARARDELVRLYLPMVRALARRHGHQGELEDAVQVGAIGLLNAIERFDPDQGGFEAFAVPTVVGEIRRHFRDRAWPVRVPRRLQELRRELDQPSRELAGRFARAPTAAELAREVGAAEEDVLRAFEAESLRRPLSLSAPTSFEQAELLSYESQAVDNTADRSDERLILASGLRALDRRTRRIVHLRFFVGLSQAQIAREVQLSQIHVSRLLRSGLITLRAHLEAARAPT